MLASLISIFCVQNKRDHSLANPYLIHKVAIIENGSLVVGLDGNIVAVGPAAEIEEQFSSAIFEEVLDATGMNP